MVKKTINLVIEDTYHEGRSEEKEETERDRIKIDVIIKHKTNFPFPYFSSLCGFLFPPLA